MTVLAAPPGHDRLPQFDRGWVVDEQRREPFLVYADQGAVNWSEHLEELHEEGSRNHFIDVWTRTAILARIPELAHDATIVDLGCSTGYLLADLREDRPGAVLFGVDLVASGLAKAHVLVPDARLVRADVCSLPLGDESVDAVVSANLLEHVPQDREALREVARVLRPGCRAVFVVPAGPGTYDYYDRFLGHERRYGRGELAAKGVDAGLFVVEDSYIASLLYPAFWLVKQRNRRLHDELVGAALEERVASDIANTTDSRVGRALWRLEDRLRLRLPFGIRNVVVLERADS